MELVSALAAETGQRAGRVGTGSLSRLLFCFEGGEIMRSTKHQNQYGNLLTLNQMCERSNLGAATVRKIAEKSGAVRKIGRLYRIVPTIFFDFIDKNCLSNQSIY